MQVYFMRIDGAFVACSQIGLVLVHTFGLVKWTWLVKIPCLGRPTSDSLFIYWNCFRHSWLGVDFFCRSSFPPFSSCPDCRTCWPCPSLAPAVLGSVAAAAAASAIRQTTATEDTTMEVTDTRVTRTRIPSTTMDMESRIPIRFGPLKLIFIQFIIEILFLQK